ncbi:hypothetical protein GGI17_000490 [Coemansia sp. S146]|nr:hypothetical protein GGI17_000490 [Coemansia sp. S146]
MYTNTFFDDYLEQMSGEHTLGVSPDPSHPPTPTSLARYALRSPSTPSPFLTVPSAVGSPGQINPDLATQYHPGSEGISPADTARPEPAPSKKRARRDDAQPAKRHKLAAIDKGGGHMCEYHGCWRVFSRKFNLEVHRGTHTGKRPFSCGECNKRFSRNNDLKRHLTIHSGKRPHPCFFCRRSFVRTDALARHMANIVAVSDIKVVGVDPSVNDIYYVSIFGDAKWKRSFLCKKSNSKARTKQRRYAVDAACDILTARFKRHKVIFAIGTANFKSTYRGCLAAPSFCKFIKCLRNRGWWVVEVDEFNIRQVCSDYRLPDGQAPVQTVTMHDAIDWLIGELKHVV